MKVFDWGFPKEGEECPPKKLWKAWHINLFTIEKWHLGTVLVVIFPLGVLDFKFGEGDKSHNFDLKHFSGWYWLTVHFHTLYSILDVSVKLPLGKWRCAKKISRIGMTCGLER